jgi:hypothetical protein
VDILSEDPLGDQYLMAQHKRGFNPRTPTTVFEALRDFKQEEKLLKNSTSLIANFC